MNRKERRAAQKQGHGSGPGAHPDIAGLFASAVERHQSGKLAEAEAFYRQLLTVAPGHLNSLRNLGILALQAGRPAQAIDVIGRALAVDERMPDCHYNVALALHAVGRLDEGVAHYRRAIALKPDYAEAHMNLGNALAQQDKLSDAAACYQRVIALLGSSPAAHYNLANLLARQGRTDEAIAQYRRALALKPDLLEAHNNLATALMAQGRPDEALGHWQRALALDPDAAETHVNLGNVLLAQGAADAAAAQFEQALALRADLVEAQNNLGIALVAQGEFARAEQHYRQALALRPDFVDAYNNLARLFLADGRAEQAMGMLSRALAAGETGETKALFVRGLRALPSLPPSADLGDAVIRAMTEPWGRPDDLAPVAAALIKQDGALAPCIARAERAWPQRQPAEEWPTGPDLVVLAEHPLLCCLLESACVADLALERFLTALRAAVLQRAAESDGKLLRLACALARQCFGNDYVFAGADDEIVRAGQLRDSLTAALDAGASVPALWVAAVAAYFPLHALAGARSLLQRQWSAPVEALLTQQLREPLRQAQCRATIPALTPTDDDVSRQVRQQYEENPYPRWTKAAPPGSPLTVDRYLRGKFPLLDFPPLGKGSDVDILIAGCGTGQHAIETAQRFPGARILAVDLSLASLAYAKTKAQDLGLQAIEFAQADILQLGSTDRRFDVIEASGVLHHLADPFAGWRVLLSLLRARGCMQVALYSALARRDLAPARDFITAGGYSPTAADIRRCRQDLIAAGDPAALTILATAGDFFSTSGCRDLLFHVQEHRLTLPQIGGFLADQRLEFLGFEADPALLRRYAATFPADRTMTDLMHWHAFEIEHPRAFLNMYQFWVQKAG
jgi:tetratricopeptide (TPR) repeat protein/2-polyprenyl-3-methyl-5-hydroxy-6-metoxy-1,4-benzoquinol methylase